MFAPVRIIAALVVLSSTLPLDVRSQSRDSASKAPPTPPQSAVPSEPFGLRMGMARSALRVRRIPDSSQAFYIVVTAPRPHPRFESYAVVFTEKTGVCKVIATGVTINSSVYGDELRSEFESVRTTLQGRYGTGELQDFLRPGSIWDEPRDWMMGLYKKERVLGALWSGPSLPPDITAIWLQTKALGPGEGWLSLAYEFSNFTQCQAEIKQKQRDVF